MGEKIAMRNSFDIAHSLLDVDSERMLVLTPRVKLFAFILAIINLFPSGFSESLLRSEGTGYYLSLFLFIHSAVYALFALSYFIGSNHEILLKTRIFPTNSIGRMAFVLLSIMRHPFSIALIASNSFFFLILYRQNIAAGIFALVLYLLLIVSCTSISTLLFLFMERRRAAASIALVFAALLALIGLVSVIVLDAGSFMLFIPLVSTSVKGIQSALQTNYIDAGLRALILTAVSAITLFGGKRFV